MLKRLKKILTFSKKDPSIQKKIDDENDQKINSYVYNYPPFPQGLPAISIEKIINTPTNQEIIKNIILARGLAGKHNLAEVDIKIMSPIRHLAEITHLLPSSEKEHFRTPGGLFRFSLECALFAIRYSERRILTRSTPEIRRDNENLWAQASFLTGLFTECIAVISRISVYAEQGGIEWHPGIESIFHWLQNNNLKSYHIRWNDKEERSMFYALAGKVIQREQAEILHEGEKAIYLTLVSALNNPGDEVNVLSNIHRKVRTKLIARDNAADSSRYGRPLSGMHLEPWLIDAMRHLVEKKRWVVNTENGRLWHGIDGVYLVWPIGASDMQYELKESECPFVPNTTEILAELMQEAGIIDRIDTEKGYLFDIAVPQPDSPEKKHLTAIRLVRHEILFEKFEYTPLEFNLQLIFDEFEDQEVSNNVPDTVQEKDEDESPAQTALLIDESPVNELEINIEDEKNINIDLLFGNQDNFKTIEPCQANNTPPFNIDNTDSHTSGNIYDADYANIYNNIEYTYDELIPSNNNYITDKIDANINNNAETTTNIQEIKIEEKENIINETNIFKWIKHPPLSLLNNNKTELKSFSDDELKELSSLIESILKNFSIDVKVGEVRRGPVITLFELHLAAGVKISRITNLSKDLARGLSVTSIRIVDVISGKTTIGLEVPNQEREIVLLRELLESQTYIKSESKLTLAIGKDVYGIPMIADLEKMPHALVAGTTGSGKSVAIHTMVLSLLYKMSPDQLQLIMIDPKMLELSIYEGIPHLFLPIVTETSKAGAALQRAIDEMERRYLLMSKIGTRSLEGFNQKVKEAEENNNNPIRNPLLHEEHEVSILRILPFIVIFIDELADMMMVDKKIETLIVRLAQKARAAGIHLILATQRPSADVLTGLIKANIPTRFSFQVSSRTDSRTILDQSGAETLIGNGDMLYLASGSSIPTRAHGAYVDEHEIYRVVEFLRDPYALQPNSDAPEIDSVLPDDTVIIIDPNEDIELGEQMALECEKVEQSDSLLGITFPYYQANNTEIDSEFPPGDIKIPEIKLIVPENTVEDVVIVSKANEKNIKQNVSTETGSDIDLLNGLLGLTTETTPQKKKTTNEINTNEVNLRKDMLVNNLRNIPNEFIKKNANGTTKIYVKGIRKIKLDIKYCISILKLSDSLILVDGVETGYELSGNNKAQYFLVKSGLLNDK